MLLMSGCSNVTVSQRNDIPDSVKGASDAIDTTSWGTPSAAWPASGCDPSKYFKAQQLVLDITLCGDLYVTFTFSAGTF